METFKYILFSSANFAELDGVKDANCSREKLMYCVVLFLEKFGHMPKSFQTAKHNKWC